MAGGQRSRTAAQGGLGAAARGHPVPGILFIVGAFTLRRMIKGVLF
jgi:hypothetical protein